MQQRRKPCTSERYLHKEEKPAEGQPKAQKGQCFYIGSEGHEASLRAMPHKSNSLPFWIRSLATGPSFFRDLLCCTLI